MAGHDAEIDYYNSLEIKPYIGAIILVLTLMVLGIVGNVHVLFVYTFRMKATSHRIFIIVLAVLDLLSCTVSMPFITADMFHRFTFNAPIVCRILRFFLYFFAGSSGFLLLPIAVDRYLKTCRPFGQQVNPYRAKLLCAVVLIFCVFSFWPIPVLYGHSTVITPNPNITGVTCYLDDAFKDTFYLAYWNGIMMILAFFTVIGLTILYYMIGKSIRKHAKAKNKLLVKEQTNKLPDKSKQHTSDSQSRGFLNKLRKGKEKSKKENVELKKCTVDRVAVKANFGSRETSLNTEIESSCDMSEKESTTSNIEKGGALNISDIDFDIPVDENKDEQTDNNSSSNGTIKESQRMADTVGAENELKVANTVHKTENAKSVTKDHNIIKTNGAEISNNGGKCNTKEQTTVNRENSRKHREALRNLKRSKRTTKMFFAITVLYFVTFIPHLTLQVITLTQDNFVASLSFAGQTVYHIVFYCSFLNSMVNCYVYGFFDTMFRDELRKIYTCKFCNSS